MKFKIILLFLLFADNVFSQSRLEFVNYNLPYENRVNVNFNNALFNKEAMSDSCYRKVIVYANIFGKSNFSTNESWIHNTFYFDNNGLAIKVINEGFDTMFLNTHSEQIERLPILSDSVLKIAENDTIVSWYEIVLGDTLCKNYYKFDKRGNLIAINKSYNRKISTYYECQNDIDKRFYYDENNSLIGYKNGNGYEYLYKPLKNGILIIENNKDTDKERRYAKISQKRRFNQDIIRIMGIEEPQKRKFKIYLNKKDNRIINKITICTKDFEKVCYTFEYLK
jgi:hypothetical protein